MPTITERFTPSRVADYFLNLGNETGSLITPLKLQKLVYYAQAWHLALYDSALFDDEFEAWVHGPVVRSLWEEYRGFEWRPIGRENVEIDLPPSVVEFLGEVAKVYFSCDPYELERMTHLEAPWLEARGNLPPDALCNNIISKESMKQFYRARASED